MLMLANNGLFCVPDWTPLLHPRKYRCDPLRRPFSTQPPPPPTERDKMQTGKLDASHPMDRGEFYKNAFSWEILWDNVLWILCIFHTNSFIVLWGLINDIYCNIFCQIFQDVNRTLSKIIRLRSQINENLKQKSYKINIHIIFVIFPPHFVQSPWHT